VSSKREAGVVLAVAGLVALHALGSVGAVRAQQNGNDPAAPPETEELLMNATDWVAEVGETGEGQNDNGEFGNIGVLSAGAESYVEDALSGELVTTTGAPLKTTLRRTVLQPGDQSDVRTIVAGKTTITVKVEGRRQVLRTNLRVGGDYCVYVAPTGARAGARFAVKVVDMSRFQPEGDELAELCQDAASGLR